MPRVFLSPSTQENNYYVTGGTEEQYMNLLCDQVIPYLQSSGIAYTRNDRSQSASAAIAQANAGKPVATVLSVVAFLMLAFVVYRVFSKKKPGQSNATLNKLKTEFMNWRMRCQQSGEYKFFTCPGCRNHLRVPRGKGKIQITCPKCGQRFGGKS